MKNDKPFYVILGGKKYSFHFHEAMVLRDELSRQIREYQEETRGRLKDKIQSK